MIDDDQNIFNDDDDEKKSVQKVAPSLIKEHSRKKQLIQSYDDLLKKTQFDMLQVAFNLLDSNNDGKVSYRDLRCHTTTIPEFQNITKQDLLDILHHISVRGNLTEENNRSASKNDIYFTLSEWISFLRHRLFLCDLTHHHQGWDINETDETATNITISSSYTKKGKKDDVQAYGIELRRLRGQLVSSLKIKMMKSQEFERSQSMINPPQKKLEQIKKHEERMSNKAVELCTNISDTEMAFWNAKIPGEWFKMIVARLGKTEDESYELKKNTMVDNDNDDDENSLSNKIRPLISVFFGTKLDHDLGNLMMEALQGGGKRITEQSIRACYILSHATGYRLMRGRMEDEDIKENADEVDHYDTSEENEEKANPTSPINRRKETSSKKQQPVNLGKEKQLLSFVSRSLLPHSF
jgi:hypothetical protein